MAQQQSTLRGSLTGPTVDAPPDYAQKGAGQLELFDKGKHHFANGRQTWSRTLSRPSHPPPSAPGDLRRSRASRALSVARWSRGAHRKSGEARRERASKGATSGTRAAARRAASAQLLRSSTACSASSAGRAVLARTRPSYGARATPKPAQRALDHLCAQNRRREEAVVARALATLLFLDPASPRSMHRVGYSKTRPSLRPTREVARTILRCARKQGRRAEPALDDVNGTAAQYYKHRTLNR